MSTTLSIRKVKARKEHQCDWCGAKIKVGEVYDYHAYVDGVFFTWKNHEKCMWIAKQLNMFDWLDGVSDSDFYDFIDEYYSEHIDENDTTKRTPLEKLDWVIKHKKGSYLQKIENNE